MAVDIIDFDARSGSIDGLLIVTIKQVTDERGTIREIFRRSAFEAVGVDLAAFDQINVTETSRAALRGMHAENMTKLVSVVAGAAFGAYVDLRSSSPTFLQTETVDLVPGTQVLVPRGVANGFQSLADGTLYAYCFDEEWQPGMPGISFTPIDPDLGIAWPLPVDRDNPSLISAKDRDASRFDDLRASFRDQAS